jgi:hypothetical protein
MLSLVPDAFSCTRNEDSGCDTSLSGCMTSMHNVVVFGHFLSIDLVGMSINFSVQDTLRVILGPGLDVPKS